MFEAQPRPETGANAWDKRPHVGRVGGNHRCLRLAFLLSCRQKQPVKKPKTGERESAGAASLCHSSLEGNMRLFRINTCSLLYGDQVQRLMVPEKRDPLQGRLQLMSHTNESKLLQFHLQSSEETCGGMVFLCVKMLLQAAGLRQFWFQSRGLWISEQDVHPNKQHWGRKSFPCIIQTWQPKSKKEEKEKRQYKESERERGEWIMSRLTGRGAGAESSVIPPRKSAKQIWDSFAFQTGPTSVLV